MLVKAYRDGGLSRKRLDAARDLIRRLHLFTVRLQLSSIEILDLAERYHLQGYDVPYFHLAVTRALPLATLDHGLLTAAHAHRVPIFDTDASAAT